MRYSVLILFLLAGCANLNPQAMTPEQLSAAAKSKDANIVCTRTDTVTTDVVVVYVNVDKGVVEHGVVAVQADCTIMIQNEKAPK